MSTLVGLFHHRWSAPILAELHRGAGSRFVTLANRLGLSRESLSRTLTALIQQGLIARNPGYGHPLRPEYILTDAGAQLGPPCREMVEALDRLGLEHVGLKKWSMPTLFALASRRRSQRFSELQAALPGITGRALAFALKDLVAAGLVERTVTEDYPPATVYRITERARPLRPILRRLAGG
ncbi:MAG: winged helix-turn-helix transcriptional regulator [Gaiellaceae bacterium]